VSPAVHGQRPPPRRPRPVRRYLPEPVRLIGDRTIDPGRVFDLTLPLDEAATGYQAMDRRTATKVLLIL
jgi:threonine dehydrogenase-like Zn-dependent dehydrogenase